MTAVRGAQRRAPSSVPSPVPAYLLAASGLLSAAVTLLVPGLLTGPAAMNGSARGTALTIALGGVPVLLLSLRRARSGSLTALAVTTGATAYLLYNAVLLVLGTPFNRAFLLYEAMLGLGIWTMADLVREIWARSRELSVAVARWPAGFVLGVVALNLAAWARGLVPALVADDPRSVLDGTGLTTNPVYVQDLAFWLPAIAWVAVGAWRREGHRTVLTAAALAYWALESASVAADQWWGHHADPSSSVVSATAVPMFVAVGLLTLWPLATVLRALSTTDHGPTEAIRPAELSGRATGG